MSEVDLLSAAGRGRGRTALDLWVRNPTLRSDSSGDRTGSVDDSNRAASDTEQKREGATFKRGKLERKSPVVCETCGDESCSCWRSSWARMPRGARSLAAQCTCEARSPRRPPPRLSPRALSDDEDHPRRLYKSASQKLLGTSVDSDRGKKGDPLLETTC